MPVKTHVTARLTTAVLLLCLIKPAFSVTFAVSRDGNPSLPHEPMEAQGQLLPG
jgi:hypothetical protein